MFWKTALETFRTSPFNRLCLSEAGALSQLPIWHNPNSASPNIPQLWADLWSTLDCNVVNVVHNAYADGAGMAGIAFTRAECEQCFPNYDDQLFTSLGQMGDGSLTVV
eukprot:scaffold272546_cov37-Tisochrysis_lutea.AAC.1